MKIFDIIALEKNNSERINLIKEGLFWRAYEFSAFAFNTKIKVFKLTKRMYKNAGMEIVCLGFPESSLKDIMGICNVKGYTFNSNNELIVEIHNFGKIKGFIEWKKQIPLKEVEHEKVSYDDILKRIRQFPLISKTPFEAQKFLLDIQNEINGNT